ncbi:hypothetical protein [Nostoc sp. UCD121]|uniref:hypothetical protein n=1 Tax=Nostoc sp. UCD121 TaxID=2681305 RepID=UPI00162A6E59|nr:hypothetical protein [Nostoc sp. UCD121]
MTQQICVGLYLWMFAVRCSELTVFTQAILDYLLGELARKAEGRRQKAEGNSDFCPLPRPKGVRVEAPLQNL